MFPRIIYTLGYYVFKLFYRVEVRGKENLPKGPFVICFNHTSNLDPVLVYLSFKKTMYYLAKNELFKSKILAFFLSKMLVIPVDRNGNDIKAVKNSIKVLKDGHPLVIFPEGTRYEEIDVNSAKAGAVFIAFKGGCDIVPAAIIGSYKLWSKMIINIGKPIGVLDEEKKINAMKMKDKGVFVMQQIKNLSEVN